MIVDPTLFFYWFYVLCHSKNFIGHEVKKGFLSLIHYAFFISMCLGEKKCFEKSTNYKCCIHSWHQKKSIKVQLSEVLFRQNEVVREKRSNTVFSRIWQLKEISLKYCSRKYSLVINIYLGYFKLQFRFCLVFK